MAPPPACRTSILVYIILLSSKVHCSILDYVVEIDERQYGAPRPPIERQSCTGKGIGRQGRAWALVVRNSYVSVLCPALTCALPTVERAAMPATRAHVVVVTQATFARAPFAVICCEIYPGCQESQTSTQTRRRTQRDGVGSKGAEHRPRARACTQSHAAPHQAVPRRANEKLAEYGWKPHRDRVARKNLSRASIYRYTHENQRGTASSNSRCQTVPFRQHSANLSHKGFHGGVPAAKSK